MTLLSYDIPWICVCLLVLVETGYMVDYRACYAILRACIAVCVCVSNAYASVCARSHSPDSMRFSVSQALQ